MVSYKVPEKQSKLNYLMLNDECICVWICICVFNSEKKLETSIWITLWSHKQHRNYKNLTKHIGFNSFWNIQINARKYVD